MKRIRSPLVMLRQMGWVKGALIVFIVLTLAGCGSLPNQAQLPGMAVLFAQQGQYGRENLVVARYNAHGQRQGKWISVGPLGLVAQTEIMASHAGTLWITTGHSVKQITQDYHVKTLWSSPKNSAILSVAYVEGHLWVAVERIGGRFVDIYLQQHGHFADVLRGPLAITTLYPAFHALGILRVWPNRAQVELWRPHKAPKELTVHAIPQGTMVLTKTTGYLPITAGLNKFGIATMALGSGKMVPHLSFYHRTKEAIIEVIPSNPPYGMTVQGVVPLSRSPSSRTVLRKWPHPLAATVTTAIESPASWMIILDGPSQGLWFNPRLDRFGPAFHVVAPQGEFPRAVVPWSG